MRTRFKFLMAAFLWALVTIGLQAQEAVTTAGGEASGGGGTVSYTVGQVVYSTFTSETIGSISQGVQQPYEIFTVGLDEAKGVTLEIAVYPNPVADFLKLRVEGISWNKLIWKLYDISGKRYSEAQITGTETTIAVSDLKPGVYLLSVINTKNNQLKTFRIIKY